jgi:hypothetical protein
LVAVANNSFNFAAHGAAWLPSLRDLVVACGCWRLTFGDLDPAAEAVLGLVDDRGTMGG